MTIRNLLTIFLFIGLVNLGSLLVNAQEKAAPSQGKEVQQSSNEQQTTTETLEEIDSGYTYDPTGKRDPFKTLKPGRGAETRGPRSGPVSCPGGCLVSEMELKGIVKDTTGTFIAILVGPDKKPCKMKVGDRFFDGEIISIDLKKVTIKEEVQDPTEIIRFREVVKYLHPTEGKTQ